MKQIINQLFHRIKQDSLERKMAGVERQKEFRPLESVKTALVLRTAHEKETEWLKKLDRTFRGLQRTEVCFTATGEERDESGRTVYVKKEDLKFGGKVDNGRLTEVLGGKYDLLIDLSLDSHVLVDYIRKNARAACKASVSRQADADLWIDGATEPVEFIEKLYQVLSKFKTY